MVHSLASCVGCLLALEGRKGIEIQRFEKRFNRARTI